MPKLIKGNKRKYNIHNITSAREDKYKSKSDNRKVKNLDIICLDCGTEQTVFTYGGFKGVRCRTCRGKVKLNIYKVNYRATQHSPIIDSKSIPHHRPMFIKRKR